MGIFIRGTEAKTRAMEAMASVEFDGFGTHGCMLRSLGVQNPSKSGKTRRWILEDLG